MANIYKKVNDDLITNTQKDVYTVPGNTRALVKSIPVSYTHLRAHET